jgi:hypothetical protein
MNGSLKVCLAALFASLNGAVLAGPISVPNTFTSGSPAVAAEVNANFSAVVNGVNANDTRITTLETNPSITGNITLVPSTATAGNILKGTTPFIHNFGTLNTFIGESAGNFTMLGGNNTATGAGAFSANTFGVNNTATGVHALAGNTTGNLNTANGASALVSNNNGGSNTASGHFALFSSTNASRNTAVGAFAASAITLGADNTAIGYNALSASLIGHDNIAIGSGAGGGLGDGSNNIAIGNPGAGSDANTIRIGTSQTFTAIAGISGVAVVGGIGVVVGGTGQLGVAPSSRRFKDDIADMGTTSEALMKLRPVTFHYKSDKNPKGRTLQYGLVAEEVAQIAPGLVARSTDGKIETVYYQFLAPMLLNEVQKQQRTIAAQTAELAKQKLEIAELRQQAARIAELEKQAARMAALVERLEGREKVASAGR